MIQNSITNNERTVTCTDFLGVMYPQPPADLSLELRRIHPKTGEVRALWTQIRNAKQREAVSRQSDKLNGEGFSVYFAPCLRHE